MNRHEIVQSRKRVLNLSREGIESLATDKLPEPNITDVKLEAMDHYGGKHVPLSRDPLESEIWMSSSMAEKDLEDESRIETVKETARHEAAHSQHLRYLELNGNLSKLDHHSPSRHIANAHMEAIANYQGSIDPKTDETFTEKEELYKEFESWITFGVEEFQGQVRPSSAHLYGRIVASLEDRANNEVMDRQSAKRTTRQSLISNTSVNDLDDVERKASSSLGIPSFLDMVNEEYERIVSTLGREKDVEGARTAGEPGLVKLHDGLDGAFQYADNKLESAERQGDLEDYMSLLATAGACKAAGLEYNDRSIDPVYRLTREARRIQNNSDFRNPGV